MGKPEGEQDVDVEAAPVEAKPTPTPSTRITLGGKERTLRLTKGALLRLEDERGITVGSLGRRIADGSMRAVAEGLWAGLLHEQPGLTPEEAVELIDLDRYAEVLRAVDAAIDNAFPDLTAGGGGGNG